MTKWLIVCIDRIIIIENRKWFWIIYSNLNTFHVESLFKFKTIWNSYSNTLIRIKKAGTTFRTKKFEKKLKKDSLVPVYRKNRDERSRLAPLNFQGIGPGSFHQPGRKGRPFVPVGGMNRDQCPENLMALTGTFRPGSSYKPGPMSPFSIFFQTF